MKYPALVIILLCCSSALNPAKAQQNSALLPQDLWVRESWTNVQADRTLKQIRTQIEKAFATTQAPDALLHSYESAVHKQPQNPRVLFARGYAAILTSRTHPGDFSYNSTIMGFAATDIDKALKVPNSYEYSRLRFMLLSYMPGTGGLIELGQRLLKRKPNDVDVKHRMTRLLLYLTPLDPPNKQEALRLINDVIRADPRDPAAYSSRGGIYWFSWQRTKSESDRRNAIASYSTYLKLSKPSDKFRPRAQGILRSLQKG